ncbi:MAG: response regulator transcription factor [Gemmatimonadetes bacterium]|nr:response regulator transcription factor [Gemmatimonadota bacterium]
MMATPGATILIVEDDPGLRRVFRVMLETAGYRVHEAGTAKQALESARLHAPALVLLDLGLPDAAGLDVARAIRSASGPTTPRIIAMTGRSGAIVRARILDAGCDDHVVKPIEPGELRRRIPAWLEGTATGDPAGSPA